MRSPPLSSMAAVCILAAAALSFLQVAPTASALRHQEGRALGRRALLHTHGNATDDAFWVFAADGIHVVDPLQNTPKYTMHGDLCLGGSGGCNWGYPVTLGRNVLVATYSFREKGKVLVFDQHTGDLVAAVPTCYFPFRIDTAPWRSEVYVHCWKTPPSDSNEAEEGIVDILNAQDWGLRYPLVDAVFSPESFLHGDVVLHDGFPDHAWSVNSKDPGIHKIHLEMKTSQFISLESSGCKSVYGLALSAMNKHGYMRCNSDADSFVLEFDMESDTVVKKLTDSQGNLTHGTPYTTQDGKYIVVLTDQEHEDRVHRLLIYKANQDGVTPAQMIEDDAVAGFSNIAFAETPDNHVAVVTTFSPSDSSRDNKVLFIDMEDNFATTVVQLPERFDNSTADTGQHGGQRYVAAGALADGRIVAAVSAQQFGEVHVFQLGNGTSPVANADASDLHDVQNVPGDSPKMIFVSKTNEELGDAVNRATASAASVARLEAHVRALENSLVGVDKSNSFWVFADGGMHVLDASQNKVKFQASNEDLCDGGGCTFGYPVTDGERYVAVANLAQHEVLAFDIHSGHVIARVPTCVRPYHIDLAPWREEIYVRCWMREEDDDDGIVDVLSTKTWKSVRLLDAVNAPSSEIRFHIYGNIFTSPAFPSKAWSTNYYDPGIHQLNLEQEDSQLINLESEGCTGTNGLVISPKNRHGFVRCKEIKDQRDAFILEMNLDSNEVVQKLTIAGDAYVTKDGAFVVIVDTANDKLHVFQARDQGQPSEKVTEIEDDMEGFSNLAFMQKPGTHVAVVASATQNKVLLVDMENNFSTKVVNLPEDPNNPGEATVPDGHAVERFLAGAVLHNGQLVAAVSAQSISTVHLISLGDGSTPISEVSSEDIQDVESISGSHPKFVYVPAASASAALIESAQTRLNALSEQDRQMTQRVQSLEGSLEEANAKLQAQQSGSGGGGDDDEEDDARGIAIAGLVIACIALAIMIVIAIATAVKAGTSSEGSCVQPRDSSFQRLENRPGSQYKNPM